MGMKKKILSSIILLLVCVTLSAMSMLHPGDIVKGKKITKTYYCFTSEEVKDILIKLHERDTYMTITDRLAAVESERSRYAKLVASTTAPMQAKVGELQKEVASGTDREKKLAGLVKIEQQNVKKERRGRRRDRFFGWVERALMGGAVIYLESQK